MEECTKVEQRRTPMVGRRVNVVWKDCSGYTDGCSGIKPTLWLGSNKNFYTCFKV